VRFTSDINKRFLEWTHGNDNNEKLGAIMAIGKGHTYTFGADNEGFL
jgi:hypothetical protein